MSPSVIQYNECVEQQRSLTQTIQDALGTIGAALADKERLARKQKHLQAEIPVSYPEHSVADVRRQITDEILRRLEQRESTPLRDWTIRLAGPGGNLED